MFTSLFQLEQKPVTVFSSDDAGAPILTKDAGSLKTLLKACLVTGYGSKASLGWQMLFESVDTKSAAFASQDPTSSKFVFKIDNGNITTAKLSAYQSMTDILTGVNPIVVDQLYDLHATSWRLIGHSKTFILLLDVPSTNAAIKTAYPLLFGDLPREVKRTPPVCVMWNGKRDGYGKSAGVCSILLYNYNVNGNIYSGPIEGVNYAPAYPFRVNEGATSSNIIVSNSRFTYDSNVLATALFEPIFSRLNDSTWTMFPMFQPLSAQIAEVANLGQLSVSTIKIKTGFVGSSITNYNDECAVPIDWWYA